MLVIDNYSGRFTSQTLTSRLIEWKCALRSHSSPVSLGRVSIILCHARQEHISWPCVYSGHIIINQLVVLVRPSAVSAPDGGLCSVVVEAFLGGRTPIGISSFFAQYAPRTTRDAWFNPWWDFLTRRPTSLYVCQDEPGQITVHDSKSYQQGPHSNHRHPPLHFFANKFEI